MKRVLFVVAAFAGLALAGPATAGHVDLPAELERDALGEPQRFGKLAGSALAAREDRLGMTVRQPLATADD